MRKIPLLTVIAVITAFSGCTLDSDAGDTEDKLILSNDIAPPENLRIIAATSTSVTIAWDDDNSVYNDFYQISYCIDGEDGGSPGKSFNVNCPQAISTIFSLESETIYRFSVSVARDGYCSDAVEVSGDTMPSVPGTPRLAEACSDGSVRILADDNSMTDAGYYFQISTEGSPDLFEDNIVTRSHSSGSNTTEEYSWFSSYYPFRHDKYYVRCAAESADGGQSDWSGIGVIEAVISDDITPPENLRITESTSQTITIEWDDDPADTAIYRIEYGCDSEDVDTEGHSFVNYPQTTETISYLDSETLFTFTVLIVRGGLYSRAIEVSGSTKPTRPGIPLLENIDTNGKLHIWSADNSEEETGYIFQISTESSPELFSDGMIRVLNSNEPGEEGRYTTTVSNFTFQQEKYYARCAAKSSDGGLSDWSHIGVIAGP